MPSSLNGPGRLAKERIPSTDVLCCEAMLGRGRRRGGGSGVMSALISLLMASLSLKLPQS